MVEIFRRLRRQKNLFVTTCIRRDRIIVSRIIEHRINNVTLSATRNSNRGICEPCNYPCSNLALQSRDMRTIDATLALTLRSAYNRNHETTSFYCLKFTRERKPRIILVDHHFSSWKIFGACGAKTSFWWVIILVGEYCNQATIRRQASEINQLRQELADLTSETWFLHSNDFF